MNTCETCKANKVCDHNKFGFENCGSYNPEWIPVTERLPEDREWVLVWHTGYCTPEKAKHKVDCDPHLPIFILDGDKGLGGEVTHWMPLPEPPKGNDMKDNEIIESLKICANDGDCAECKINPHVGNHGYCTSLAIKAALDLVDRKKAEMDRLQVDLEAMRTAANSYKMHYENARKICYDQALGMVDFLTKGLKNSAYLIPLMDLRNTLTSMWITDATDTNVGGKSDEEG